MTRADIIDQISKEVDMPKKDIDEIVVRLQKAVVENLVKGETVYLRGFGTFGTKVRKERMARNLKTNEKILVPEHKTPYFQAGKDLKAIKSMSKKKNA